MRSSRRQTHHPLCERVTFHCLPEWLLCGSVTSIAKRRYWGNPDIDPFLIADTSTDTFCFNRSCLRPSVSAAAHARQRRSVPNLPTTLGHRQFSRHPAVDGPVGFGRTSASCPMSPTPNIRAISWAALPRPRVTLRDCRQGRNTAPRSAPLPPKLLFRRLLDLVSFGDDVRRLDGQQFLLA